MDCHSPGASVHENLHPLPQGIFLTQGLNSVLQIVGRFFTVWATREAHNSVQALNGVWLFATPWTAACQTSLSITKSRSYDVKCNCSLEIENKYLTLSWKVSTLSPKLQDSENIGTKSPPLFLVSLIAPSFHMPGQREGKRCRHWR